MDSKCAVVGWSNCSQGVDIPLPWAEVQYAKGLIVLWFSWWCCQSVITTLNCCKLAKKTKKTENAGSAKLSDVVCSAAQPLRLSSYFGHARPSPLTLSICICILWPKCMKLNIKLVVRLRDFRDGSTCLGRSWHSFCPFPSLVFSLTFDTTA